MHGIICRAFEGFVRTAYGEALWRRVRDGLDPGFDGFEPMFHYDDALVDRFVRLCAAQLGKPREALLEDFGTYLVAGVASDRVRRLLRYGGLDYVDFLQSLEDLPGRATLAVPDIGLPELALSEDEDGRFRLSVRACFEGGGHVVAGLLRALADDYGALVVLDQVCAAEGRATILIDLLESAYSEGRGFDLSDALRGIGA